MFVPPSILLADIEEATDAVTKKTQDLRQHLRKAVADHVSDVFVDPNGPLETLVQTALNGDVARVDKDAETFAHHAEKIIQVYIARFNFTTLGIR